MKPPTIGISIATRDRWRDVGKTLSAIASQPELRGFPVIVADDGSDEPAPRELSERFRNVEFLSSGRSLGASAQRTRIARILDTDYILQLDDDSYPVGGSVSDAVSFLGAHEEAAALALNIVEGGRKAPAVATATPPFRVESFIGCGVLLRRSLFLELGGFIGALGFYCEETHFSARAAREGLAIYKFPSLVIRHEKSPSARSTGRIAFYRGRNRVLLVLWNYPARAILPRLATSLPGTFALVRWRDYPAAIAGFLAGLFDGLRMMGERRPLTYGQYLSWRALPPC
jgi:GT2 family glycosyltransferase